jgi:lipopolysaccharide cholinephosphotransferase
LQELSFEGYTFYGPADTDQYLRKIYGDYMTPPPEEERKGTHARQIIIDTSQRGAFYRQLNT